jgi:hypothetical protein
MKYVLRFTALMLLLVTANLSAQEIFFQIKIDSTGTGNSSVGKGTGFAILSNDRKSLRYDITVNKLSGTISSSHFHYLPTTGVVQAITFNGKTASGTWSNIPDTLVDALFKGNIYVNVHTASFPGGEIRGRLDGDQFGYPLIINGAAAGTASNGRGTGYIRINDNGNYNGVATRISYRATYAGMSGNITAAHFHALPSGSVIHPVSFVDSTLDEEWINPPDSVFALLLRKNLYLNIHSTVSAGGEIRANIPDFVGEIPFSGILDGAQASTASTAKGTVWAVLRPDLTLKYNATYAKLQGTFSAAHFHTATGGGVIHPVSFVKNHLAEEWTTLSNTNLSDFLTGKVYLNVHSSTAAGGEIRANMAYRGGDGMLSGELDGTQASTTSLAKGTVWVALLKGDSVQYHATIANLEGTFSAAHFHILPSGNVIKPVTFIDSTTTGYWTSGIYKTELLKGNVYLNVHSSTAAGGEIRANLKLGTGIATSVASKISSAVPERFILEQNYPNPFNPSTVISYQLPAANHISLKIYDLIGREVATLVNEVKEAGYYSATFNASKLSSGIYFSRLQSGDKVQMKKMMLIK